MGFRVGSWPGRLRAEIAAEVDVMTDADLVRILLRVHDMSILADEIEGAMSAVIAARLMGAARAHRAPESLDEIFAVMPQRRAAKIIDWLSTHCGIDLKQPAR